MIVFLYKFMHIPIYWYHLTGEFNDEDVKEIKKCNFTFLNLMYCRTICLMI